MSGQALRAGLILFVLFLRVGIIAEEQRNETPPQPVYTLGAEGVSTPHAISIPDPQYSEEARRKHVEGTIIVTIVIGPEGRVHDMKIKRSVGYGLDEKAMEAISQWQFEPVRKEGEPVAVRMDVEVSFRLYSEVRSRKHP